MKQARIDELKDKIRYVREELRPALMGACSNVENVDYDVFVEEDHGWTAEFLVISYRGGAKGVRTCTANSKYAIFGEAFKYGFSGCYDDLDYYAGVKEKRRNILEFTNDELLSFGGC